MHEILINNFLVLSDEALDVDYFRHKYLEHGPASGGFATAWAQHASRTSGVGQPLLR